jgi:multidrug efflux pump subunit AcrA (membrane-fusion protein)
VVALAILGAHLLGVQIPGLPVAAREGKPSKEPSDAAAGVVLVKDKAHTLEVPEDVRVALGIRKGKGKEARDVLAVARVPTVMQPLTLTGSTALDPTQLARIRARFAPCRVVSIGQIAVPGPKGKTEFRELRPGDRVQKGDVLGVFYSVDVGSKKNDLLDALVQLELDQRILDNAEKHREAVSEVQMLTFIRAVQGDRNAINRALNNLEVWDIPQDEIDALHAEAKKLAEDKNAWFKTREGRWVRGEKGNGTDKKAENPWGRVTLRAPFDGVIVERNLHLDEMVVDNTVNLFQIADVNRLLIIANAPEDDLPTLEALANRQWSVRTVGAVNTKVLYKLTNQATKGLETAGMPGELLTKLKPLEDREFATLPLFLGALTKVLDKEELERYRDLVVEFADTRILRGPIEEIGYLIDPNQHTAVIKGYVSNPGQRLRAGQYVSATVLTAPPEDVVEIPIDALVDDGKQAVVFVQTGKDQYTMRRVQVMNRFDRRVFVRSSPIPEDERITSQELEEGLLPKEPLRPGDRILPTGAGELKVALLKLESEPENAPKEEKP